MPTHKRPTFCNHYRAMSEHDTCEVGIHYDTFKGMPFDQRPCFRKRGEAVRPGCDLAEFPTPEEEAEYEAESKKRFENIVAARRAIVAHLGGPWAKGAPGASGNIPCPVCKTGELRFSRAGYNGHIHAGCTTDGCVGWLE